MSVYAPTKALRHLDIIEAARHGIPARPAHVYLLVSDACNQGCSYCSFRDPSYPASQLFLPTDGSPRRLMDYDLAISVLRDCADMGRQAGSVAVEFSGGGEPTCHPRIRDLLVASQAFDLPYAVVTNGTLVRQKHLASDLARARWVRVSLDTASPAIYSRLRGCPPGHFEAAWSAVTEIREERDRLGSNCVIGVSCIVGPDNWPGAVETARRAREAGADNLSLAPQWTTAGMSRFTGFRDRMLARCAEAEQEAAGYFTVYNRVPERLRDLERGAPSFGLCGHSLFTTLVGSDANVYRCCALAYNRAGLVGSLQGTSFRHFWLRAERVDEMTRFDARQCARCPYHTQGHLLEYVLGQDEPAHAEFV